MLKTRPALVALLAAAAALLVLLAVSSAAPAQDLESKLESKEAKLAKVRERRGVLTTTISHYGDRIDRLTAEVGALHRREAAVRLRLDAKQAELDRAVAQLDVAKKHLAVIRARLKRSLVALRERLVAMYESGTPDVLSLIVGANGYDELIDRTEYLNRIHGMDEAVVGRVRELRDQVRRTVVRLRTAKDRIETARDAIAAEEQALASARTAVQQRQAALVSARAERLSALHQIRQHEEELDGSVAAIQGKIAAQLAATGSAPLPAGPIRGGSGSGLIWPVDGPVVSGFGPRTINGQLRVPPGDRHRRSEWHADSGCRCRHSDLHRARGQQRRLRQLHLHRSRRWALHLLRAPGVLRGLRGPARLPGPGDRLQRLHRLLLRPARPLRGPDRRRSDRPDGLSVAIGNSIIRYIAGSGTVGPWVEGDHGGVSMIRQAHTYLAGAVSGTALIAAAVVGFVMLVSLQALKDWPLAGIGGGESTAVSTGRPAGAANPGERQRRPHDRRGRGRQAGTGSRPAAPGRANAPGGQDGVATAGGPSPGPSGSESPATNESPPSSSTGGAGSTAASSSRRRWLWLKWGQRRGRTGAVDLRLCHHAVNETVSGVDQATRRRAGASTGVTEEAVNGVAGPESPVGKTVDKVVETVGGLLGGGK